MEVSPSLKARFGEWIDRRSAVGYVTYGTALTTHNGRSAELDMLEEILDFCQYQEQSRLELIDEVAVLKDRLNNARRQLGLPPVPTGDVL